MRGGSVRDTPPGWLRLVTCNTCARRRVLPADLLLPKHGELKLLQFALGCMACSAWSAIMTMMRFCELGCGLQR